MAVPAAPQPGEPIAEAWGDVVHGQVVAMEIQAGSASCNVVGGVGTVAITFPHPFKAGSGSVYVMVNVSASATNDAHGEAEAVTPTGFSLGVKGATNWNYACSWIAYGERA